MGIHNYRKIIDDIKKLIYNMDVIMVMVSTLAVQGVDKMMLLTIIDKTTRILVKILKNFKCKFKHFVSSVLDKYNKLMVMIYIRYQKTYVVDERILKNCIYMIYNDYSKYYIFNDFSEGDIKLAENDMYINGLFYKISTLLHDFIQFMQCKMVKHGNVEHVHNDHHKHHSSNYGSFDNIVGKHIDHKNGYNHNHKNGYGSSTTSHNRYFKSTSSNCKTSDDIKYNKHCDNKHCEPDSRSTSDRSSKCKSNSEIDKIFHKKHSKNIKHNIFKNHSDSKKHKTHNFSDSELHSSSRCDHHVNKHIDKMPEFKMRGHSDSSNTYKAKESCVTSNSGETSMSDFSFIKSDNDKNDACPEIFKEMKFLIKNKECNPGGERISSSEDNVLCPSPELDAIKQKQYLIDNGIQNPNTNKKYKKVCDILTCNSSDVDLPSPKKIYDCKSKRNALKKISFDNTSEVCDFPASSDIFECNKSEKECKKKSNDTLSIFCEDDNSDCDSISSQKDSLMCNSSIHFSDASVLNDKICSKYKHYIPQTKKILKTLHRMLMCGKMDSLCKKDVFNTIMKIKNNKDMYHIFKLVSQKSDYDFDEMVIAIKKLSQCH